MIFLEAPSGQICNYASGATSWSYLQPMKMAPTGGPIFKFQSERAKDSIAWVCCASGSVLFLYHLLYFHIFSLILGHWEGEDGEDDADDEDYEDFEEGEEGKWGEEVGDGDEDDEDD